MAMIENRSRRLIWPMKKSFLGTRLKTSRAMHYSAVKVKGTSAITSLVEKLKIENRCARDGAISFHRPG